MFYYNLKSNIPYGKNSQELLDYVIKNLSQWRTIKFFVYIKLYVQEHQSYVVRWV